MRDRSRRGVRRDNPQSEIRNPQLASLSIGKRKTERFQLQRHVDRLHRDVGRDDQLDGSEIEDRLHARLDQLGVKAILDRKSTRLNSSHRTISYAVFCLKKKKEQKQK